MIPPELKLKFLTYCRMTSAGGSEHGTCFCNGPDACRMKNNPYYKIAREEALDRMEAYMKGQGDNSVINQVIQAAIKNAKR